MSKETLLGYVILFAGVLIGWALKGLWISIRKRWHKAKFADAECIDGRFRIIRQPRIFEQK